MENEINENEILNQEVTGEANHGVTHEVTLYAEPVAHIGNFQITNALVTSWVSVLLIVVVIFTMRSRLKEVPSGMQNFFEWLLDGALSLCDQVTGSRKISEKVFPYGFSIFIFFLINNWIGLLPLGGFGIIEQTKNGASFIPFLRSGTADINTTLAVAFISVVAANLFGIISIGLWKTFNKYVNLKALGSIFTKIRREPITIIVAPVTFFVGIIEFVGEFTKVLSLSFRLFGNVFAGEVLLLSMGAIFAYILPLPFIFLEIFVGVIQALIFPVLVLVYFTIAAQDHNEHEPAHA